MSQTTFDPVWHVRRRPRPSFEPARYFALGVLVVQGPTVEFHSKEPTGSLTLLGGTATVDIRMNEVQSVGVERYGWGLFPRFVVIRSESEAGPCVAYFNDAGWNGWRPLLTRSNKRMAASLRYQLSLR